MLTRRDLIPVRAFPAALLGDRLLDSFFSPWGSAGAAACGLSDAGDAATAIPAVNMWEDDSSVYVETELPGMSMDDADVSLSGNELTIRASRAERAQEGKQGTNFLRRERRDVEHVRVLTIPADVDPEKVTATMEHGVLTVTLPKATASKTRKISVTQKK